MSDSQPDRQDPAVPVTAPLPRQADPAAPADTEFLEAAAAAPVAATPAAAEGPTTGQTQPLPRVGGEGDYRHPADDPADVPVWSASDTQPEVSRAVRPLALVWALLVLAAGVGLAFAAAGYRPNLQFSFVGLLAFVGGAFIVAALVSLLPGKKQR